MVGPRNRKHILVPGRADREAYSKPKRKMAIKGPPAPPDRASHGRALKKAFESAVEEAHQRRLDAAPNASRSLL